MRRRVGVAGQVWDLSKTPLAGGYIGDRGGWPRPGAPRSSVWAWGFNGAGELGDGTTTSRSTPVQVTGLSGVTHVAARSYFSVALRSDGTVWAWGDNRGGQLGRGTTSNHEVTPARVRGLARVTKISAGASFVLAPSRTRNRYSPITRDRPRPVASSAPPE